MATLKTLETIHTQTIENKQNLESPGLAFRDSLRVISVRRAPTMTCCYDDLLRISLIAKTCDERRRWADPPLAHTPLFFQDRT